MILSVLIVVFGLVGALLIARRNRTGLLLASVSMFLWVAWSIANENWPFLVESLVYSVVYPYGYIHWKRMEAK